MPIKIMQSEENPAESMRRLARAQLPDRAFLKRDRGDCLLITNAPAFDPEICRLSGFLCARRGVLLALLPDESWIEAWEDQPPADSLSEAFLRFRGQKTDMAALKCFAQGAKLLDGGASGEEQRRYEQNLRQWAALALRNARSPGALYASALLNAELKKIERKKM